MENTIILDIKLNISYTFWINKITTLKINNSVLLYNKTGGDNCNTECLKTDAAHYDLQCSKQSLHVQGNMYYTLDKTNYQKKGN